MRSVTCLLLFVVLSIHLALGCGTGGTEGGGSGGGGGDGPSLPGLKLIAVTPATTALTAGNTPQTVTFTATGAFADGSSRDVTNDTSFTLSRPALGSFSGSVFTSAGIGGTANVIASIGSVSGQATLTVTVDRKTIGPGVPNTAPDLFGGSADPTRQPTVSTPYADTLIPPNIGIFEFAWNRGSDNNLWELGLSCENFSLKTYLTTSTYVMTGSDFTLFAESCRGKDAQIVVRGIKQGITGVGTSPAISFALAEEDVEGGVYYWSNDCVITSYADSAIYRFDFGAPKQAEGYYGPQLSGVGNSGRCVGCHAVSQNGKSISMAATPAAGGNSWDLIVLDAATRKPRFSGSNLPSVFAVFSPDGNLFINGDNDGVITLYDANTGDTVGPSSGQLPLSRAAQPDWSLDGSNIVVAQWASGAISSSLYLSSGSIAIIPFNGVTNGFGSPAIIVQSTGTVDNYYPCFTPDGGYILFNRAVLTEEDTRGSYGNNNAKLMLVPVAGGESVELIKTEPPDHQRHSWPRASPFLKHEKGDSLVWFTFSSNANDQNPPTGYYPISQIYMAALRLPANGDDPVPYASFHLPYQATDHCNHIAQWTQVVVPLEY